MEKSITVLKGDGIGPEVVNEAIKVLKQIAAIFDHQFNFEFKLLGGIAIDSTGVALPQETLASCKETDATLLGAIGDPKFDNNPDVSERPEKGLLALRKELELFANIRPIKIYKKLKNLSPIKNERLENVDFIIYRELTGGIYFGEKQKTEDFSSDLCKYYDYEIKRIAHLAFQAAQRRSKKLCLIDKANVLESSRLWRKCVQQMQTSYPDVSVDYLFVDNAAMQIILNPAQFDVILTSNMFGDIISDEASVLPGSIGLLPSASFGTDNKLYEPVHGSYPQASGKNIANPLAMIASASLMLQDFGLTDEANEINQAIEKCVDENWLTIDLNKKTPLSCSDIGDKICALIKLNTQELIF